MERTSEASVQGCVPLAEYVIRGLVIGLQRRVPIRADSVLPTMVILGRSGPASSERG